MRTKTLIMGALLMAGLLSGCGGAEGQAEPKSGVEQQALCSDCDSLFVRCMSRAKTPEAQAACEASLADCREAWCGPGAGGEAEAQELTCEQKCANQQRICMRDSTDWESCSEEYRDCRWGPLGCTPTGTAAQ
ncbi:hypothetical protein JY651_04280 [Pyxidicoccus parkwayensis]|jgi:hypothetical protein|uniref:Lipoprotein n=1 Tax=Pyxidicoccus parkwayensis TaxID=2813578 RepID=A0ABX7P1X1_9BACT|nr:hypothetical protein [Pyxidicoccus parkwaysis]QSQ24196.1 hypothetical protein JY651_04280 [Pyxidicoccus parkwaysis]